MAIDSGYWGNGTALDSGYWESGEDTEVPTNADHIRSMTDEELARFLLKVMSNAVCFGEGFFPYHPCPQDQDCEKCGAQWLKQPYKEEK